MVRQIISVIAGLVTVGITVAAIQMLGHYIIPMAPGSDPNDPEAVKSYIEQHPAAMLFVLISYAAGAFLGGFVATKLAKDHSRSSAFIIGAVFALISVYMMLTIPTPFWFWVLGIAAWGLVLTGRNVARRTNRHKIQ